MNNIDSFYLGIASGIVVCSLILLVVWFGLNRPYGKPKTIIGMEALTIIHSALQTMAESELKGIALMNSMAETLGMIYTKECASMEALIQIRDLIENPKASVGPVQSVVDYDRLDKIVLPLKDALFRIAADTEMGKKKFDVIAKVIGLDAKNDYANYIDERPEEPDKGVFEELVVEEMRGQGLSYHQAVDAVKGRMAHRSRARQ